ncbi:hypothetical protein OBBRIDRAFT_558466 [Obba rivulosa]|uniref:CCD97-like C-terminal domain-containing protein n=1 Tax=Obba rivulosa TaxID=1052685 RepID=A0A8E2AXH2_9APHY|nr:hypothetical protein OBBRIDRAFT_558466 [Obba rivulosa]
MSGPEPSTPAVDKVLLSYLGLPRDYQPSPSADPVDFLLRHLRQLPPHLSSHFTALTVPKQRTTIPAIRNRRLTYVESDPPELRFEVAKATWPTLWPVRERGGKEEGKEEKEWANKEFMGSSKQHVGKLGTLLAEYEEEREAERVGTLRRQQAEQLDSLPEESEEEEEEEDEDEDDEVGANDGVEETLEDIRDTFMRVIKDRFIYGLLESIDYDKVDWDDKWDAANDRDAEEQWFDEEEESAGVPVDLSE